MIPAELADAFTNGNRSDVAAELRSYDDALEAVYVALRAMERMDEATRYSFRRWLFVVVGG